MGAGEPLELSPQMSEAVRARSHEAAVTPYIFLLAVLVTLLYRRTGEDDVVVGSPIANRTRAELENVIGFCSNTLPLRVHLSGNATFRELVGRVREVALDAYEHQEVPFERIVEAVRPHRTAGVNSLFQVNLRALNSPEPPLELADVTTERSRSTPAWRASISRSKLQLRDDGIGGYLRYDRALFEPGTARGLVLDFQRLLVAALTDPGKRLLDFELLSVGAGDASAGALSTPVRAFRRARARSDAARRG